MKKSVIGIAIILLSIAAFGYIFSSNGFSRTTKGQIVPNMKLGTTHEIESTDGKVTIGEKKHKSN